MTELQKCFVNLNWRKHYVPPSNFFFDDEDEFMRNSFVYKSFRTEFEVDNAFSANGIKYLKSLESDETKKQNAHEKDLMIYNPLANVPGYSRFSSIQKQSLLSKNEMNECFGLFLDSLKGPLTPKQIERYKFFQEKINTEQAQYLSLAQNNWLKVNYKRHTEIKPDVVNFVNSLWKEELCRVSKYPAYYCHANLISLVYQCSNLVEMNLIKEVRKIAGRPGTIVVPPLKYYIVNLHSALNEIPRNYLEKLKHPSYTDTNEVSQDPFTDQLARENSVNIVLSSSSFVTLLSNHYPNFNSSWDLPITIKEHKTECGGKKTIVFIDRPLPVKSMNMFDRNKRFCKIGCEYVLLHKLKEPRPTAQNQNLAVPESYNILNDSSDGEEEEGYNERIEENQSRMNYYSEDKCEESNNNSNADVTPDPSMRTLNTTEDDVGFGDNSSCSDDGGLVIAEMPDEGNMNKFPESEMFSRDKAAAELLDRQHSIEGPPRSHNITGPPTLKMKAKKKKHKRPQISYKLWSLKKSSQVILSKTCSKDLTLLIRCNEGHLKLPFRDKDDKNVKWIVSTKMEYQTEFGAEAMTLDELSEEWGTLFIRPNTKLLRVRVNPLNGELIMFETKSLSDVAAECLKLHKVNMLSKLASVYSVMEKLADQPPGRYHLSHMPKNSAFVPLYKESVGSHAFNLHTSYSVNVEAVTPERSPWIPIDVSVLTPVFRYLHRVPATFRPYIPLMKRGARGSAKKDTKKKTTWFKGKMSGPKNKNKSKAKKKTQTATKKKKQNAAKKVPV